MRAALDDHLAHLECKLAGFRSRPELHRHQITAATATLAAARAAADPAAYLAATDDLFELARAEWLDRHFNLAVLHHALANPIRVAAADAAYRAGLAATGHADFTACVTRGMIAARAIELAADTAEGALAPLLIALLEWKTAPPGAVKDSSFEAIHGYWRAISGADPGCDWQTLSAEPRYRQRLPFDDDGLALLGGWLAQALGDTLAPCTHGTHGGDDAGDDGTFEALCTLAAQYAPTPAAGADTCDGAVPSAASAAAGYRRLLDELPANDPAARAIRSVCEDILEAAADARDAGQLARRIAEAGLDVAMTRAPRVAMAEAMLERSRGWSQPHIEHHTRALIDTLNRARTTTEIELEVAYHEACFAIESAWSELLLTYATRALRAALSWEHDTSEARRQSVVTSYRASAELLGLDWDGLLTTRRVWSFVRDVLHREGQRLTDDDAPSRGAGLGEVGCAVTLDVQKSAGLTLVARVERGEIQNPEDLGLDRPRFETPEAMTAHATALFEDATGGGHAYVAPGPPSRRTLRLWRRPVPIDEVAEALSRPPRPELVFPGT